MLGALLKQKGAAQKGESVFLRADQGVPFGTVAMVVDELRQSGIEQISMVTEPLDQRRR
jgi:biopolymer transport protein ExbD/biopolymer transport protein TolR